MRIVIGNLPDDSTEESLREELASLAPVEAITIARESSPLTAVIETGLPRTEAEHLAKRIHGRSYRGHTLTAWVPKMDWK
jgi:hypothetical protein